jgi:S-adenosylmethionine:tRNA-ribosyltransferase-isomerase (queuine synthetase)
VPILLWCLLEGYARTIAAEMLFFEFGDATLTLPD